MRGTRIAAAYLSVAGVSLMALAGLNLAADHFPGVRGLGELRDYLVRRNG